MIEFYCQSGSEKAGNAIQPLLIKLNAAFELMENDPASSIVDATAIVLRVSGQVHKFEGSGCERLRFQRKKRYMQLDLIIPETTWSAGADQLNAFLVEHLHVAKELFAKRLEREDKAFDRQGFQREFAGGMDRFLNVIGS